MSQSHMRVASDLAWLFSVGQSAFERSALGGMLERAQQTHVPTPTVSPELKLARLEASRKGEAPPDLITAQPNQKPWYEPSVEPDERALLKFGSLSRRLNAVARKNPQAARALGAAFGPVGAACARLHSEQGPLPALLHLVPSGIDELAHARKVFADKDLTEPDLLRVVVIADAARERSSGRMARAMEEATELLREALELWAQEAA